jgi:O-antigen ligase
MKNQVRLWALFAGPLVTLALGFGWTLDQVNTIKLLMLGVAAGFAAAEVILIVRHSPRILFSPVFIVAMLFLLGLLVSLALSDSPIAQQIYGASGRNLGFLHYFFLTLIFLGFSTFNAGIIWPKILRIIVAVGIFEATYGFLQFFGVDPLPWKNPDNWIFGTFGNPNYLSSFLALSVIATIYTAIVQKRVAIRFSWFAVALFQSGVILLSGSSQGLILVVFGLFAVLIISIFQSSKILGWAVFSLGSLVAIVASLGVFQIGPLTKVLYQDSVAFRGDYWRAGIKMFSENWIHGVGLDSYGDYYRMYRDAAAASRRGLDIYSNSAHNLFIDIAATGGVILLLGYLFVFGLVSLSIFRAFRAGSKFTFEYKVLIILWLAFNLQTLISINVAALAVWGWIFSGLILAYRTEGKYSEILSGRNRRRDKNYMFVSSVCCAACMFFVSPLISRDVKLNDALSKNDIQGITQAVLTFPRDADQIAQIADAFGKANLGQESLELAEEAISENVNSPLAWQVIAKSSLANQVERDQAVKALTVLDPFYAATLK